MCLSAEMDLVVGSAVTLVGCEGFRHVPDRRYLPIAAVPVVLGVHQLVETLVWWDLEGVTCSAAGDAATVVYLAIALCLLPVLVPLSFALASPARPRVLSASFLVCGVITAALCSVAVLGPPTDRRIDGHHISYATQLPHAEVTLVAYVVATCGPALVARQRLLRAFGLANLAAVALLAWLDQNAVISLWCVWAAVTSVVINVFLRQADAVRRPRTADLRV